MEGIIHGIDEPADLRTGMQVSLFLSVPGRGGGNPWLGTWNNEQDNIASDKSERKKRPPAQGFQMGQSQGNWASIQGLPQARPKNIHPRPWQGQAGLPIPFRAMETGRKSSPLISTGAPRILFHGPSASPIRIHGYNLVDIRLRRLSR